MKFTTAVLKALSERYRPIVFVFWGGYAQKLARLIDTDVHLRHPIEEHCTVGELLNLILTPARLRRLKAHNAALAEEQAG